MSPASLKCTRCEKYILEEPEKRRLGSMTITAWTRVGLVAVALCAPCAQPIVDDLGLFEELEKIP